MTSHIGTAEVFVCYRGGPDDLEKDVLCALEGSFGLILPRLQGGHEAPCIGGIAFDPEGVANRVAQIIATFSRFGSSSAVRVEIVERIRLRIFEAVRRRIPVEVQMLWSPKKHWILGLENTVDLAELAAFQTLLSVDVAVRGVYRGGVSFLIDIEDIEFEFMEMQNEEVARARETYISSLKRFIKALQLGETFTLRSVSEHAKSSEELMRWRRQITENHRVLEVYWYESEGLTLPEREELGSFKELRRLGWKGTIPPEMRRYYLHRLGQLANVPDRQKVDMVLRNLAGILLHHQIGLLHGSGVIDPVRFSFVRPADATPAELLEGRLDLRFAPRKLCSRIGAAAPWSTKGFVCRRGGDVRISFRGWHELASQRFRFAEGWFTLTGREDTADVRADFLCEEAGLN
jgi:hypothetical protein